MKILSKSFNLSGWLVPGVSVMDRYIVSELFGPFLFGVGAFSSLGIAIGSVFYLVRRVTESGLPMAIATKVSLLQMPYYVFFALPMGMLLAALIAYSRLSSDSELIALRSCGVSIYRLLVPAIVMSLIVTAIAFTLNEFVVPAANYEARQTLDSALKEDRSDFEESNIIYPEFRDIKQPDGNKANVLTRLFYAEQFDGQEMKGLTILDRSQSGLNQIVTSEKAKWNPVENTWDFFNGTIYVVSPDSSYRSILRFDHHQLQLPRAPLDLAEKGREFQEMNLIQAQEELQLLRPSGNKRKIRKLVIRIHQKIALPFACVVFGLVGSALGIRPQRTNKATGFGISVLVIFAYYLLMSMGDALGLSGVMPPELAAWLPNLFGVGVGIWLLFRLNR
ncbi:LptF/LptG family permease [Microseira sp. BLCC-F43]|uniref:LptF/LptG family permease n=1 Tax=Microseira sp. BLCC-F43 TaxID=3153602 RepID=UPI0035B7F353